MEKCGRLGIIVSGLVLFPGMLSAQVEHWQFSAITTGMEAPFFKDVYTAPGHYRIYTSAEESSTDFIADSLTGELLALMQTGEKKKYCFYGIEPDGLNYYAPGDLIDFDAAQIAVNLSGETKIAFGWTLLRIDLYLGGKPIGEAWVAEGAAVPGAYTFALPDGRWVAVLELTYEVGDFHASKRFTGYELLETEKEQLFPMDIPEGYEPPE